MKSTTFVHAFPYNTAKGNEADKALWFLP